MTLAMQAAGLGIWQIVNIVVGGVVLAAMLALARLVNGKANKADVDKIAQGHELKADKVDLNRVESESKAANQKMEVRLEAAMLIVGASITRPELAEKILAMTGRSDDKIQRIVADLVQLTTDTKANAKATAETDKRLDDLPGRVRSLEEIQRKT